MTVARLLGAPSEGHGLVSKHTDKHYRQLTEGQEPQKIVAVVVFEAVGTSQRKTARGLHRTVVYEAVRLEPVTDAHQATELQYLAQNLYEQRTSNAEPRYLPLGFSDMSTEEKRRRTIETIEDWAEEAGHTGGELEAMWRDHFGIAEGSEYSYGDQGVPGDYRKSSLNYLLEFGYAVEALSREKKLPHEEREEKETAEAGDGTETGDNKPDPEQVEDAAGDGADETPTTVDDGAERHLASVPEAAFSG